MDILFNHPHCNFASLLVKIKQDNNLFIAFIAFLHDILDTKRI